MEERHVESGLSVRVIAMAIHDSTDVIERCTISFQIVLSCEGEVLGMDMKKQIMVGSENLGFKKSSMPPPPPPLPPSPGYVSRKIEGDSITNKQIKKFWRQKQIIEEEHLFAAIKAAARVRARNLSDEDYRRFEESLDMEYPETEVHEGIKDWWMKSKYAYLNQPALGSADSLKRKRFSTYVPNYFSFKPCIPLYATSLNVF
ncbi:hypothetical protein F2Q69_00052451 [Brassica cretica]|uniref:Uncharacterized protein n=1 Tax=Brassica cretica TaxID=69181 RepID=A0A8S9MR00_BRACR|nr:hypothetical protein F2Q69_00052451 [Brassica cretica]